MTVDVPLELELDDVVDPFKKSTVFNIDGTKTSSVVYTDPAFAQRIVDYYAPEGLCLDPCRGGGAFYDALPDPKEYCEIREGSDFLNYSKQVDWIITNPPWEGKVYAPFAAHCFKLATNVVFLVKLFGALGTRRRLRDAQRFGHGLKEIIVVDWKDAAFRYLDGTTKAPEGFLLSVCHWQRGWLGGTTWTMTEDGTF